MVLKVVQVAKDLSRAGSQQVLPAVRLRPLSEGIPVNGVQFWDELSLPGRIDLLLGGPVGEEGSEARVSGLKQEPQAEDPGVGDDGSQPVLEGRGADDELTAQAEPN